MQKYQKEEGNDMNVREQFIALYHAVCSVKYPHSDDDPVLDKDQSTNNFVGSECRERCSMASL